MLNEYGFKRPTFDEIVEDLQQNALETLGYDTNVSDTGNIGKILKIVAYMCDQLWQDVEGAYLSAFVGTATGVSLDRVAASMGLTRDMDISATATVTFVGDVGYLIEEGFEVCTDDNIVFTTTADATIGAGGTVDIICECEESGVVGNVGAGDITTIVEPIAEVVSVVNNNAATGGKDKETDAEFRERIGEGSNTESTTDAILTEVMELSGVMSATVVSNDTNLEVDGRPAHSFETYVYGGSDAEIAQAIWNKKPTGIQSIGDVSINVSDIAGQTHVVNFSRPTMESIYIKAKITTNEEFSTGSAVATEIIKYIGGLDEDQSYYFGLKMNEPCIYTKLVNIIMSFAGVEDVELQLSQDNSEWVQTNITPSSNSVLEAHYNNVVVEVG